MVKKAPKFVSVEPQYAVVLGVRLNDSWRRALRTLYQLVVTLIPVLPTLALLTDGNPPLQTVLTAFIAYGAVVTKVLNALEDKGWIPAYLKAPASDGAQPVPEA